MQTLKKRGPGRRNKIYYNKGRQVDKTSLEEANELLNGYFPLSKDMLIEYLHLFNDKYKGLYPRHLRALSELVKTSMSEVYEVAKMSFCDEFIKNLPNKYETLIGENGVRLSGGEKQRLSIARAMMKKSSIILLDEATSSLDSETETKIQDALKILTKDKTTIVIAHRLSTILNSNNIYVVDSGNIIDSGKHDELILKSDLYKSFYEKQIQK